MSPYPTSAFPLKHLIRQHPPVWSAVSYASAAVSMLLGETYVSPVIVFFSLLYLSADMAAPPSPPSTPNHHLRVPDLRFTSSAKTIMQNSNETSCAAWWSASVRTNVCRAASHLHTFVKGENLCTKPLCNAASSLMRPAGIGGLHCQFAVKALRDRRGSRLALWNL